MSNANHRFTLKDSRNFVIAIRYTQDNLVGIGLTTLVVVQNATLALEMCDRAFVLETGKIRMEEHRSDLLHDARVMESYRGITK